MVALTQLLLNARDALSAQSFGIGVTGQNVTNVNTTGYVRRDANLATRVGGGVVAVGIRRAADQFLDRRWFAATGASGSASEREGQLSGVESLFADAQGTGLGDAISGVFDAFQTLSQNPSDPTARQGVLDKAAHLTTRLNDTANAIAERRQELLQKAQAAVAEVNAKASEVAQLNRQIAAAEARGEDASDLIDQRNQLILGISSLVDVRTFQDGNGDPVLQAAGTTLVEGDVAATFSLDLAADGSLRLWAQSSGPPATEVTAGLSGGKLAGLKEVRDTDLVELGDRVDQLAWDVASAINTTHAAGFGLDGVGGRVLFALPPSASGAARQIAVDPTLLGHPDRVAASSSAATVPGGSDNAVALAGLADDLVASGGTRTASEAWADVVGDFGTRLARARDTAETRSGVLAQTEAMRQSESGVSLDEEMVNLTKFQHAYDASAKVLATVDELMRELIDKVGR